MCDFRTSASSSSLEKPLGLPPMQLAESRASNESRLCSCETVCYIMRKLLFLALVASIAVGTYVSLSGFIQIYDSENPVKTVITQLVRSDKGPVNNDVVEISFQLKNTSFNEKNNRKKRNVGTKKDDGTRKLLNTYDEYVHAKQIVMQENKNCTNENFNDFCKELVDKIKKKDDVTEQHEAHYEQSSSKLRGGNTSPNDESTTRIMHTDFETPRSDIEERTPINSYAVPRFSVVEPYAPVLVPPPISDTCLLAKLLKHADPHHVHAVYDVPVHYGPTSYLAPTYPELPNYATHQLPYAQRHVEFQSNEQRLHPQDFEIRKRLHSSEKLATNKSINHHPSNRESACLPGTMSCGSGDACIPEKQWCDGVVDCADVSDEAACSCVSRVDKYRLCDGYFDCPSGEDEMGCYGCSESEFSCENVDLNSRTTCFSKEQRCNNVLDCPNSRDESDCNLMSPTLHDQPPFAASNTEGFLLRNYKGDWYPVCNNPYMWAHDACRRETGLIIRPPYIQLLPIDPLLKVTYMNTGPAGGMQMSDTCANTSAVYVTCPDLICGTRVPTTPQLLRENTALENRLFGRNKRFLWNNLMQQYPILFFNNRRKRETGVSSIDTQNLDSYKKTNEPREKRTELRVVGGRPSQPAAWPWMVAMNRDGKFHCGGVIINERWILSAAHCVDKFWEHYYEILIGMLRRFSFSPQEHSLRVSHVIANQNYDKLDMRNDLALLRVKPAIQFSRWVRPICLPNPDTAGPEWLWGPPRGTVCTAVGWGATKEHGPDPDHIREVEMPVWAECKHREDKVGREICAGVKEGGKDACQGDSGGPLLCKNPLNSQQWYIAGITSHGDGCGRKGEPGVYTRVSIFAKWIKHHITSTLLPTVQPKQECPGFKCSSGIQKCLSNKKVCDKIIDCLDGEDELNCESKRTFDSIFMARTPEDEDETYESKDMLSHSDMHLQNSEHSTNIPEERFASTIDDGVQLLDRESLRGDMQSMSQNLEHKVTDTRSTDVTEDFTEITTTSAPTETTVTISEMSTKKVSTPTETTTKIFTNDVSDKVLETKNKEENLVTAELPVIPIKETGENKTNLQKKQLDSDNEVKPVNEPKKETISKVFKKTNLTTITFNTSTTIAPMPAKKMKRPPFADDFLCSRISQTIPFNLRCDHKADCEDGSDEMGCRCVDFITSFDPKLLCDGTVDCFDGEDERDCFTCNEDQFLCKKSKTCLPFKNVCDEKIDCPHGDDEIDCYTLSDGKDVDLDLDGRPRIRLEGFLTEKSGNDFNIVCEDNLTREEQENAASYVCRYLGFSSANRVLVKYINIKEQQPLETGNFDSSRLKRNHHSLQFFRKASDANPNSRGMVIKNPQLIKEDCVPNVTKYCMSLYVFCESTLFTSFKQMSLNEMTMGRSSENELNVWPWVAKVYVEGKFKCSGILIDLSWVLVSHSCLWDTLVIHHYVSVILGSHKILRSVSGPFEQTYKVDTIKDWYNTKVTLLHLEKPAHYSAMVKPMAITSFINDGEMNAICVTVGEDERNNTFTVYLKETEENCHFPNRCFKIQHSEMECQSNPGTTRVWTGIISCHGSSGWHPSASFVLPSPICKVGERINAYDIGNIRSEIKHYVGHFQVNTTEPKLEHPCEGQRCTRGLCVKLHKVCDGVHDCEDGIDESEEACERKTEFCNKDSHHGGCQCSASQLKCKNGNCISKELFGDGNNDCGDGSDEPGTTTCAQYLARTSPNRLCDGIVHCHDKSDEDPLFCKCYSDQSYKCGSTSHCVPVDMICDGAADCPNGEDEQTCLALRSIVGAPDGTGLVIARSHGIWHTKCYGKAHHTRSELEIICRQLGFISGHAKQLESLGKLGNSRHSEVVLDKFHDVSLNSNTTVKLRKANTPLARAVFTDLSAKCHSLIIECK